MSLSSAWKQKDKAATLEARFEFESFEILRDFLDEVADVADNVGHHPNLSFGREHVSVIIYAQNQESGLSDTDFNLAQGIDDAFSKTQETAE